MAPFINVASNMLFTLATPLNRKGFHFALYAWYHRMTRGMKQKQVVINWREHGLSSGLEHLACIRCWVHPLIRSASVMNTNSLYDSLLPPLPQASYLGLIRMYCKCLRNNKASLGPRISPSCIQWCCIFLLC